NQFKGAALSMAKMTALLAHEIKNPLAGIKGAAQLLELDLPAEYRELSGMIVDETDRITSLLSRIENLSADAPLKFSDVNIHEVLDHCIRITKASFGRHLQIVRRYDPSLPDVRGDRELLVQCFLNLLKNAAEATKIGDELVLRTCYSMTRYISSLSDGKRMHLPLQIEIEDTGKGIPEELSEHIFEPFISTKSGGSGLGLAMVASVIADHGGTITHQRRHQGTCFSINLPFLTMTDSDRVLQSRSPTTEVTSSFGEIS
ncbi:MAG: two-component system sensor histidine kinase NtrB, partial [Candidatus Puniceispirillaceae bacterium]